jgi:hypothetical protein
VDWSTIFEVVSSLGGLTGSHVGVDLLYAAGEAAALADGELEVQRSDWHVVSAPAHVFEAGGGGGSLFVRLGLVDVGMHPGYPFEQAARECSATGIGDPTSHRGDRLDQQVLEDGSDEPGVVNPEVEVAGVDIDPAHGQGAGPVQEPAQLGAFDAIDKDLQCMAPPHGASPGALQQHLAKMAGEVGVGAQYIPGCGQAADEPVCAGRGVPHVQQPLPVERDPGVNLEDRSAPVNLHRCCQPWRWVENLTEGGVRGGFFPPGHAAASQGRSTSLPWTKVALVTFGVLWGHGGRIAEENRRRRPGSLIALSHKHHDRADLAFGGKPQLSYRS